MLNNQNIAESPILWNRYRKGVVPALEPFLAMLINADDKKREK
jgi:hypothetical protein